jgi:hypothetical protein
MAMFVVVAVMVVAFMVAVSVIVPVVCVKMRGLGRLRMGVVLEGIRRAQLFCLPGAISAPTNCLFWVMLEADSWLQSIAWLSSGLQTAGSLSKVEQSDAARAGTSNVQKRKYLISW